MKSSIFKSLQKLLKKIQKNVDIKTRKRMIRILLRGNSNERRYLKWPRLLVNATETFSFKESSLTISYHAICVDTHINLFLHSSSEQQKRLMMNVTQINIYLYM